MVIKGEVKTDPEEQIQLQDKDEHEPKAKVFAITNPKRSLPIIVVILLIIIAALVIFAVVFGLLNRAGGQDADIKMYFEPNVAGESNLIRFQQGAPSTYNASYQRLKATLLNYRHKDELGDSCTTAQLYGYDFGQPCILLHLNKIKDWVPIPYTTEVPPPQEAFNASLIWSNQSIGVTCQAKHEVDKHQVGAVQIWPSTGWPVHYFPYTGQDDYVSPLVMVQFRQPRIGIVIMIQCKAWAQNIEHSDGRGTVDFELQVD